ncbi:hypothetical protein Tco_0202314 [Tanacetum coccineum]
MCCCQLQFFFVSLRVVRPWSATLYNCYLVPAFMSTIMAPPPRGSILLDRRHLRLQPHTCSLIISRQPSRHMAASDWPTATNVAVHVASTSAAGAHLLMWKLTWQPRGSMWHANVAARNKSKPGKR